MLFILVRVLHREPKVLPEIAPEDVGKRPVGDIHPSDEIGEDNPPDKPNPTDEQPAETPQT